MIRYAPSAEINRRYPADRANQKELAREMEAVRIKTADGEKQPCVGPTEA